MDLESLRELLSPTGQEALKDAADLAPREADFLRNFSALSSRYPPRLARAALETAILRREGLSKFPAAGQMYFTRPALEQASSSPVASYRAGRFAPFEAAFDLGCSVGGDTFALAHQTFTIGVDRDPLRLAMAQANARSLGLGERVEFIYADLTHPLPLALVGSPPDKFALFFDPARRRGRRRIFSVRDYSPPLGVVENWLPVCPALGVKISPGVNLDELGGYDAEVEFISLDGELKEAVLWFGPLKTASRRATLLPGPHTLRASPELESSQAKQKDPEGGGRLIQLDEPRAFLYEPDPAILRAGLVQPLGVQLEAAQLDPDIAYLTSDRLVRTPFARCWRVEGWMPFNLKKLRAALRERSVEEVVVKKRGSPIQPEELIRALRLKKPGGAGKPKSRTLFLTHLRGRPVVVFCYPEGESCYNPA